MHAQHSMVHSAACVLSLRGPALPRSFLCICKLPEWVQSGRGDASDSSLGSGDCPPVWALRARQWRFNMLRFPPVICMWLLNVNAVFKETDFSSRPLEWFGTLCMDQRCPAGFSPPAPRSRCSCWERSAGASSRSEGPACQSPPETCPWTGPMPADNSQEENCENN